MFTHIETDIFNLIMLLILYISICPTFKKGNLREQRFLFCIIVGVAATFFDLSASFFIEKQISKFAIHFFTSGFFITYMLTIVVWFYYIVAIINENNSEKLQKTSRLVFVPYAFYVIFILLNLHFGYIYTVSADNLYIPTGSYNITVIIYLLFAFLSVLFVGINYKSIHLRKLILILVLCPVIVSLGTFIQAVSKDLMQVLPSYSIAIFIAYVFLQARRNENIIESNNLTVSTLSKAAYTDYLTGLYNRAGAEMLIREKLLGNAGKQCVFILIDLDDLKTINDTMGHDQGDVALVTLAEILKNHFRANDIVARVGDDEFVAYIDNIVSEDALHGSLSSLIRKMLLYDFKTLSGLQIYASIGAVLGKCEDETFDSLYKKADTALYHIKRNGKCSYAFYSEEMDYADYQFKEDTGLSVKRQEGFENKEIMHLLYAISSFFPLIVYINLTKNSYYLMESSDFDVLTLPKLGTIDEFTKVSSETFHTDDRETFQRDASLPFLLELYKQGKKIYKNSYRQLIQDGIYRWIEIVTVFLQPIDNDDICAITFVRDVSDEKHNEQNLLRLQKVMQIAVTSAFEYICILYTQSGQYELYANDGKNTHAVPVNGNFNDATVEIRDNQMSPELREKYFENAKMETVIKRMEESNGKYSYRYRIYDGEREAEFYYYEPTHNELLMTVRKINTE